MTANKFALWLAQGLGVGRIPIIPGTFGSGLGFLWFLLIMAPGNFAIFGAIVLLSFFISVLCSEIGEKVLRQKDPNSIVIDEIICSTPAFSAACADTWHNEAATAAETILLTFM